MKPGICPGACCTELEATPSLCFHGLCFTLFSGAELKGSMTTRQALTQCVWRGQEGRYTSTCSEGFLRTSSHWDFFMILLPWTGIRKGSIQNARHQSRERNTTMAQCVTDRQSGWPFGKFYCTFTELLLPLSCGFPSGLPVTQASAFIYRNSPAAENIPCVLHTHFKRQQWSAVGDQLKNPSDRKRDNESENH